MELALVSWITETYILEHGKRAKEKDMVLVSSTLAGIIEENGLKTGFAD
jgi:hypothetical protein